MAPLIVDSKIATRRVVLASAVAAVLSLSACGGGGGVAVADGGSPGPGTGTGTPSPVPSVFQSITLPWQVWQPTTPATPVSSTGKTYYVSPKGSDGNDGLSLATAFATPQKAAGVVQAGDTVLIAAGLYRGGIDMTNHASGQAGKPITFGSLGDGPVVIDGSTPVTGWTQVSGSVWQATASFTPIAVVVNNVPLRQVTSQSAVTSGSGNWYRSGKTIVADFGSTTPSQADLVVPNNNGAQTVVYFYGNDYLTFNGLTVRGSGASGIWGYGSHITVSHCDLEFNGKAGINFMAMQGNANEGNQALYNRVHDNVLLNWPRGNNGFASAGGGWSGGLAFSFSLNGVARGNVVYDNGGEGIISYGSGGGAATGGTLFEQNVAFDNWSVNMYFDNQPGDVARQNILFDHPMDPNTLFYPPTSSQWSGGTPYKYSVCLMLADEYNSSGGPANLANTQVYDNLMAGCRMGINEYAEGALTNPHGLKNALIANNTIILPPTTPAGTFTAGIHLLDNGSANTGSRIVNNVVYAFDNTEPVVWYEGTGKVPGVTIDNNAYFNPGMSAAFWEGLNSVSQLTFAQWQQAAGADAHGLFADPQLAGVTQFQASGSAPYDYRNAMPTAGSPLLGKGTSLASYFTTNLAGTPFSSGWNIGAF